MMKYPGPKDQYRRIERRYITRIGVGLIVIVITVLGNLGVNLGLRLIKGKEPRPSELFVGVGIVLTFGAMALGWFGLIGF